MAWTQTRNDIIKRVLRICHRNEFGQQPSQEDINNVANILQQVIEDLHHDAFKMWEFETATYAYGVISTNGFDFGTDTVEVLQAYTNDGTSDEQPLRIIDVFEWSKLTEKTETGTPSMLYIDYQKTSAGLPDPKGYLWPVVDDSDYSLKVVRIRRSDALDTASATPDFQKRYWGALTYLAAQYASDEYNLELSERAWIRSRAKDLLQKAQTVDFRPKTQRMTKGAY